MFALVENLGETEDLMDSDIQEDLTWGSFLKIGL